MEDNKTYHWTGRLSIYLLIYLLSVFFSDTHTLISWFFSGHKHKYCFPWLFNIETLIKALWGMVGRHILGTAEIVRGTLLTMSSWTSNFRYVLKYEQGCQCYGWHCWWAGGNAIWTQKPKTMWSENSGGLSVCWDLNGELGWAKKGREPWKYFQEGTVFKTPILKEI